MSTPALLDPSRRHYKAIVDMLNTALQVEQQDGRYKVYEGEVTDDETTIAYPYLVVWPPPGYRPTNLMAGDDGALTTTTQITAAGTSVDEVLAALDRAAAALHRKRPIIPGRSCGLISQDPAATPPQPDRDPTVRTPTGRPVFFSFIHVSLYTTAAPTGGTL